MEIVADVDESMVEDQRVETTTRFGENDLIDDQRAEMNTRTKDDDRMENQKLRKGSTGISAETLPGVHWDIFRRQDAPKLIKYLQKHCRDFGKPDNIVDHFVTHSLCDGTVFLNGYHLTNLKKEFGVEPWSFEQHLGQAIFIPAGCPFQVGNLQQSNVQLGLDFLSPESVGEAARLAEEIRCLPNDHEAKLQVLEVRQRQFSLKVGKISLYAASSAIKEVQKLVLDPELGADIGFEDPNLTAAVSDNLEKVSKQREISCA